LFKLAHWETHLLFLRWQGDSTGSDIHSTKTDTGPRFLFALLDRQDLLSSTGAGPRTAALNLVG